MTTVDEALDRELLASWYARNRERSARFFESVLPDAYTARPIPLRNPICFYEGHMPAFSVNTLLKRGLGDAALDAEYEVLFERGIDPEDEAGVPESRRAWPSREQILAYAERADRAVLDAFARRDIADDSNPVLAGGLAAYTVLEHEPMHQETLRYIWHRLPYDRKRRPEGLAAPQTGGEPPPRREARVPSGRATLGADPDQPFGWDNEYPRHAIEVEAFSVDVHSVTNRDFLEFVESGAYSGDAGWDEEGGAWREANAVRHPLFWECHRGQWFWRGMWDLIPLPMAWPVYVTHAEASAYAGWRGRRLMTEAEYHRAAYGTPGGEERRYPWGDAAPDALRGRFDFAAWDPSPAGAHPRGASAWGVHDLVGNGWEWTSTVFAPFEGFRPMPSYPQYSADFFDGKHYVLKGASPATARELIRPSLRNWFRGTYPYVYAKFRTAAS